VKEQIHPKWYAQATVICACGNTWKTGATVPEIRTDVCSACHPFYTGEQRIVDTEGQVERFMKRLQAREDIRAASEARAASDSTADRMLAELELSSRVVKALNAAGLETVGDVLDRMAEVGDEGMLAISGYGHKGLIDTKRALRQLGYEIAEPEEA